MLQGWGGDKLLPSYSEERRPIFKETAEDFIAARIRKDGEFLARYSPERDRAEFERAWKAREGEMERARKATSRTTKDRPSCLDPPAGSAARTARTC